MATFLAVLKAIPILWEAFEALMYTALEEKRKERKNARDARRDERAKIGLQLKQKELSDEDRARLVARLNELSAGRKRP
jgi:hypothetical protein